MAYLVVGPREVIQPDVAISKGCESLNGIRKYAELLEAFGQVSREAPLLFLHPRHVRIAENRNAIRVHRDYLVYGIAKALGGLMRQPVDQIQVDALKAELAAAIEQRFDHLVRLNSMDGLLHQRIEVLYPHTQPVESQAIENPALLFGGRTRVYLDSDLRIL